jgi:16S rRNA (cytidine1402-2'-O)-methyltransferase
MYERLSDEKNQTQLFIETPYRNTKLMEDLVQLLQPNTLLCVACDITLPTEYIKTKTIQEWKKEKADVHNRPCIFILHKI